MKTIYFRKVAKYDPTFDGEFSRYDGYSKITKVENSPGIALSEFTFDLPKVFLRNPIYSSPLKRAQETALKISQKILTVNELSEVLFDLPRLVTKNEFEKFGSNLVRERFIKSFIEDSLIETREELKSRIDKIMGFIKELHDGNYLFISHSFIMKLIEAYTKEKDLFNKPENLKTYLQINKKTYDFGKGFDFSLE